MLSVYPEGLLQHVEKLKFDCEEEKVLPTPAQCPHLNFLQEAPNINLITSLS